MERVLVRVMDCSDDACWVTCSSGVVEMKGIWV